MDVAGVDIRNVIIQEGRRQTEAANDILVMVDQQPVAAHTTDPPHRT
jgi:hypothetical protein